MGRYLGIPGYVDKGVSSSPLGYSWDGEILGNPRIPYPRMLLGWGRYLGIPGYLDKGVSSSPNPRILLGWGRYLGIPGYLDKGGI